MKRPNARVPALARATAERGRLAAAQADLVSMKARKLKGELVEAAAVEQE